MVGSTPMDLARSNLAQAGQISRNALCPCGSKKRYKRLFFSLYFKKNKNKKFLDTKPIPDCFFCLVVFACSSTNQVKCYCLSVLALSSWVFFANFYRVAELLNLAYWLKELFPKLLSFICCKLLHSS